MGFDGIELVMEIEDRFRIAPTDQEWARVVTVADLAALVISHLRIQRGACPSAHEFYEFRKRVMETAGHERSDIRPSTRLDSLFPPNRRTQWRLLRRSDRRLPALVETSRADSIMLLIIAIVSFLWPVAATGIGVSRNFTNNGIGLLIIAGFVCEWLLYRLIVNIWLRRHFPRALETVGDVALHLAVPVREGVSTGAIVIPKDVSRDNSPGGQLIAQMRVLEEVQRIVAEQMALPVEQVKPESWLVRDLGLG